MGVVLLGCWRQFASTLPSLLLFVAVFRGFWAVWPLFGLCLLQAFRSVSAFLDEHAATTLEAISEGRRRPRTGPGHLAARTGLEPLHRR
jgi:hypothetical protein